MESLNTPLLATINKAFADKIRVYLSSFSRADKILSSPFSVILPPFCKESTKILLTIDEIDGELRLSLERC
jgi:hypothetical protein